MELFSELYSRYFQMVACVLNAACTQPLTAAGLARTISQNAFSESVLRAYPKLAEGEWPLLTKQPDGRFAAKLPAPACPPTLLQRAWVAAILHDPRIGLFLSDAELAEARGLLAGEGVEPMFRPEDFHYFDACSDGDPYQDGEYRARFGQILKAIQSQCALHIQFRSGEGEMVNTCVLPQTLEYSSKDDKFRLLCRRLKPACAGGEMTINLARILAITPCATDVSAVAAEPAECAAERILLEISEERNALERCMLHFANYRKSTTFDEDTGRYLCTIYYEKRDEIELLIRVLSFGPVVRVLGPAPFLKLVKQRVARQYELLSKPLS